MNTDEQRKECASNFLFIPSCAVVLVRVVFVVGIVVVVVEAAAAKETRSGP